jgi:histidyl-tRNA synthetase
MRDFLPADVRKREYVISVIKQVYERYGFEPLETPAVENIETLMGKYGEEGNQLIFKILRRGEHAKTGEADLALRYDLTVPLARVVAQYQNELPKFFKRYQIQPVWRADRPARGRFREFYQCDVDVLGSRSMVVEAELISAVSEVLELLGFDDFTIRLNHRALLESVLRIANVPVGQTNEVLIALDKLRKIHVSGVVEELKQKGLSEQSINTLLDFMIPTVPSPNEKLDWLDLQFLILGWISRVISSAESNDDDQAIRKRVRETLQPGPDFAIPGFANEKRHYLLSLVEGNENATRAMSELCSILAYINNPHLTIDLSLVRGLSYYTGAIMEINVEGIGSLGGGGRYDNLVGMFLGKDVPACGFSLGLERIIVVMSEREMFPKELIAPCADVMVNALGEDRAPEALTLAADLRKEGLRVFVYPEPNDKFQKQLSFANRRNVPVCCVIGENESQRGVVLVKPMWGGGEEFVSRGVAVDVVKAMLLNALRTRDLDEEMRNKLNKSGKELLQKYKDRF